MKCWRPQGLARRRAGRRKTAFKWWLATAPPSTVWTSTWTASAPWRRSPFDIGFASAPLDYFLPERNVPVHLAGASELEISLPPYCSRGRLYIGRAVSLHHAEFTVEEEQ